MEIEQDDAIEKFCRMADDTLARLHSGEIRTVLIINFPTATVGPLQDDVIDAIRRIVGEVG